MPRFGGWKRGARAGVGLALRVVVAGDFHGLLVFPWFFFNIN